MEAQRLTSFDQMNPRLALLRHLRHRSAPAEELVLGVAVGIVGFEEDSIDIEVVNRLAEELVGFVAAEDSLACGQQD